MGVFIVALAGGVGAGARFLAGSSIQSRLKTEFPWGTALVNIVGSLLLGVVIGADLGGIRYEAATGFLAGFTTYSTWMIETVHLWSEGRSGRRRAIVNLVGVLAWALIAAAVGLWSGVLVA